MFTDCEKSIQHKGKGLYILFKQQKKNVNFRSF